LSIGRDIRRFRQVLGETQESLAHRMGLTVRTIARYEAEEHVSGKAAKRFLELAQETKYSDFVECFLEYTVAEFGVTAANSITDFKIALLKARAKLLDLNDPALTLDRARGIGQEVSTLLSELSDHMDEVNPYSSSKGTKGTAEE